MRFFLFFFLIIYFSCKEENLQTELLDQNFGDLEPELAVEVNENSSLKICINGYAGKYPCNGFDLVGNLSLDELKTSMVNDNWGWTDKENGNEYVLIGVLEGTAVVDISNAEKPI